MTVQSPGFASPATIAARLLLAISFAIALLAPPAHAATDADDIEVIGLKGDVRVTMAGAPRAVRAGSTLELPSTVRTGSDGSVDLRQGETTLGVGPGTQLDFPAPAGGETFERVVQPQGSAFYDVARRTGPRLRVETPYLVAVIKGTQFNVAVGADNSTISLFEGVLEVRSTDTSAVVELHAGQIAIRRRGEQGIRVIPMMDRTPPAASAAAGKAGDSGPDDSTGLRAAIDADTATEKLDGTAVGVDATVDAGVEAGNGSVGVAVDAGIELPGSGDVDAAVEAGVDLTGGTADAAVDVGADLGAASLDAGADIGADLGTGTVDASLDAGLDVGGVAADLGADAAIDAGAGAVDLGVDAGLLGTDTSIDVGTDLAGGDAGLDIGTDLLGAEIDLGLGGDPAPIESEPDPAPAPTGGLLGGLGGLLGGGGQ